MCSGLIHYWGVVLDLGAIHYSGQSSFRGGLIFFQVNHIHHNEVLKKLLWRLAPYVDMLSAARGHNRYPAHFFPGHKHPLPQYQPNGPLFFVDTWFHMKGQGIVVMVIF